ncbi:DUF1349 domain-containing protein [Streptomyces cavernicola]|uniref:DUF1349 domain-containing protein n=1 Tax=Streptomyces cavernicola TaxID=3043613 RepID=A0ABT6S9Q5_9ACTN|nr:DUF1349 domain-containing protein [Streptomyces sp. B-S-A6]MDI3404881.1 DUF1349 domain-containing protein [Streptomyces sp. B-S-A6]
MRLPELPFVLRPLGPDGGWSYADAALSGRAGPGQDRFVPPGGSALDPASDAPRLLGTPSGDFQLIARVRAGLRAPGDAGALYLHVGEREWAKLCLELSPDRPYVCSVVTRGHSDDANAFEVDGDSVWLRVARTGSAFAFHASTDGTHWTFVRVFTLGTPEEVGAAQVGFLAQSPTGEGCEVLFDSVELRGRGVRNLRDGS